jgi:hypothetical protein
MENERQFISNKKKSIKEIFKDAKTDKTGQRYIEHKFKITPPGKTEPREITVREYQPQVFNFVFSGEAKNPQNISNARKSNIEPTLNLFRRVLANPEHNEFLKEKYNKLLDSAGTPEGKEALCAQLLEDLKSSKPPLTPKMEMALRAVLVTLTGEDQNNHNYDNMNDCDSQFLLSNHLSKMAGCPISVECKSGNDRTATSMALACAQEEFEREVGRPHDPNNTNDLEKAFFDKQFNKYMVAFGRPNVVASRGVKEDGNPLLKTGKSPPFLKHCNPLEMLNNFKIKGLKLPNEEK